MQKLITLAVYIVIGAQKFMRKSCGHFVFKQSARGLAQSKTLRVFQESSCRALRLGVRRPSAVFPSGAISNYVNVNWNCYKHTKSRIEVSFVTGLRAGRYGPAGLRSYKF